MGDISSIVMIIMTMIFLTEMIIMMIPDKNKKNGGNAFAKKTYNPNMIRGGMRAYVVMGIFVGIMLIKFLVDGSFSAFGDKGYDLYEVLVNGVGPDSGKDAIVQFKVAGKTFRLEGADGAFCPIVIDHETEDGVGECFVVCLHLSSKKNAELYEDAGPQRVFKYKGRVYDFSQYSEQYRKAVSDSSLDGDEYWVVDYVFDTYGSSEKKRNELLFLIVVLIGCIVSYIVINVTWKKRTGGKEHEIM